MVAIKRKILEWLGHVIIMDQRKVARNILKVKQDVDKKWKGLDMDD
jgi:hypothetical protein